MDKQTIQAIKDSIKHWEEDFVERFKNGDRIIGILWDNGDPVKWGSQFCALCKYFWDDEEKEDCYEECPLNIINKGCLGESSPYGNFTDNPCTENAEAMITTLKSLLEGDKK